MPVITFAHRGAPRTSAEENTLPAFQRALSLGAQGLESDIGLTRDGVPVLVHRGLWPRGPRISNLLQRDLPVSIPTLHDLYQQCGHDFELSLDVARPDAAGEVMRVAQEHGAAEHLWLTYWRVPVLAEWRSRWPTVRLIYPTLQVLRRRVPGLMHRLVDAGVDAVNLFHRFCNRHTVEQAHQYGLRCFAWGLSGERPLARLLAADVDGVFCNDVGAVVSVLEKRVR